MKKVLRPDVILKELIEKSKRATKKTRELYHKSFDIVKVLKNSDKVILFYNETLKIKAERYASCVPKPHYFIRGMKFITGIHHNNYFNDKSELWVPVTVQFLIEYDTESTRYLISKDKHENLLYLSSIENLVFEDKEYQGKKYGILKFPWINNSGWDNELLINNFEDFEKIKGIFVYGCKKIGMDNLASSITNKNLIEL